jgi:hypothetical protein
MSCSVVESFTCSEVPPASILRVQENGGGRFLPKHWYLSKKLEDLTSQKKIILIFISRETLNIYKYGSYPSGIETDYEKLQRSEADAIRTKYHHQLQCSAFIDPLLLLRLF